MRTVNRENDILAVDKPAGWTSHDVVAKIKGELGGKVKVGHGGTLDPFATGVLLILIGQAVKRFEEIKTWEKEYKMTVKLGAATETGDPEGKATKAVKVGKVDKKNVAQVLKSFVHGYEQTVPVYSAVKINGQAAYKLARAGKKFVQPKKWVNIKMIKFVSLQVPNLKLRVVCGSGAYMRQLAVDIGAKLDLPAHCSSLRRTRVGDYKI